MLYIFINNFTKKFSGTDKIYGSIANLNRKISVKKYVIM